MRRQRRLKISWPMSAIEARNRFQAIEPGR
jgi:hypothetical protein